MFCQRLNKIVTAFLGPMDSHGHLFQSSPVAWQVKEGAKPTSVFMDSKACVTQARLPRNVKSRVQIPVSSKKMACYNNFKS
jgi:hypothetical protein